MGGGVRAHPIERTIFKGPWPGRLGTCFLSTETPTERPPQRDQLGPSTAASLAQGKFKFPARDSRGSSSPRLSGSLFFPPATPASPFLELSRVADFLSCRSTPPVLWRKRSKVAISAPSQCPSRERSGFSVCFLFFSLWEAQQRFLWETGPSVSLGCRPGLDPARDKALAASHPPTSPATSPEDPALTQQHRDQSSSWSPWGCSAFWKSRAGSRARPGSWRFQLFALCWPFQNVTGRVVTAASGEQRSRGMSL